MKTKEFFITIIFIIVSLVVFGLFPIENIIQKEVTLLIFFIILPILFNKFILKRKINTIGVRLGDWKQGLFWGIIAFLVALVVFFTSIIYFGFLNKYTISSFIADNFSNFIIYELVWVLFTILVYDFFFRGFIMFSFIPKLHHWAVLIQAVLFIILIMVFGSSLWSFAPFLIMAPLAGLVAYKSGSILYSSVAQLLTFIILDATVIYLAK